MKMRNLIFAALLSLAFPVWTQSPPGGDVPFLLPQTVFVGDPGRLVVPLDPGIVQAEPFVRENPGGLSSTPELHIQRIELERRPGAARLLIDFIPYAPGLLEFPSIDISSELSSPGQALLVVSDLKVNVASILNPERMSLANSAPPLVMPGTGFLIYGTLGLILAVLFLGIGSSLWGRRHFREIWERLRRRHLLRSMISFLRRLKFECEHRKRESPGFYLSLLSGELREFLSLFTGLNCRSLSAGEFLELPLPGHLQSDGYNWQDNLCNIFRNWDTLRFSGLEIVMTDMFLALNDAGKFITALDKAEREIPVLKLEKAAQGTMQEAAEEEVKASSSAVTGESL